MNLNLITKYYSRYKETDRLEYYTQFLIKTKMLEFVSCTEGIERNFLIHAPVRLNELNFGETPKSVSKKLGKPNFVIQKSDFATLIYFYKDHIINNKVISQMHFIDNAFAYAARTFISHLSDYKSDIKAALFKKYLPDCSVDPLLTNNNQCVLNDGLFFFKDTDGNRILLIDDVFLHVLYFSATADIAKLLSDFKLEHRRKEEIKASTIQKTLFKFI